MNWPAQPALEDRPTVVYRIGQLGDTVVSLPAIAALRRESPDRRLILLTDRHPARQELVSSWDIVGALGLCDEVMHYDVCPNPLRNLQAYAQLARRIRVIAPREIVNLAPRRTPRDAWRDRFFFRVLCGVSSYRAVAPTGRQVLTGLAVVPEWFRLLRAVDPSATDAAGFRLNLPAAAINEAKAAMLPLSAATRVVAFGPGSKMASKRWPIGRFKEVGRTILGRDPGSAIVVLGGTGDRALGEELQQAWGSRSLNLCGHLSILGAAAALARCAAYVGNDTGTMHLAGLVGTRCVGIFSARDAPGKWVPLGEKHQILRKHVACEGCMLEVCDKDNLCLTSIGVEEVVAAWNAVATPP